MRLALDGLTSTSIQPLRWGLLLGGCSILLAVGLSVWALYRHLIVGQTVSGWTSLMVVVLFFSSMQLILMGLMGEYIGKIFLQVRGRPGNIVMENNGTDPGGTYTAPDRHSWVQRNTQGEKKSRNPKNRSAGSLHPNETWHPP